MLSDIDSSSSKVRPISTDPRADFSERISARAVSKSVWGLSPQPGHGAKASFLNVPQRIQTAFFFVDIVFVDIVFVNIVFVDIVLVDMVRRWR